MINKTILIADDDYDYLFQMKFRLESAGFNTITASTQRQAETLIEAGGFDACVIDLMMENDDSGFVLAYKVKRLYPQVPVIITTNVASETGYDFQNDRGWIKADLYLEKGVQSEKIVEEIKNMLNI